MDYHNSEVEANCYECVNRRILFVDLTWSSDFEFVWLEQNAQARL